MILHTLASRRADYIERRGLKAKYRRQRNAAIDVRVNELQHILPQAEQAGNVDDAMNIRAAIIDLNSQRA